PRNVVLKLTDEADEIGRSELPGHLDALADLGEQRVPRTGTRESRRPAGVTRSDEADARQAGVPLRLHHRRALLRRRAPEAVRLESIRGDGPDAIGARHRARKHDLDVDRDRV